MGETTIALPVAPVFQEYVPPPVAVSVAFCPAQMDVLAVLMFAAGVELTATEIYPVSAHVPADTITE